MEIIIFILGLISGYLLHLLVQEMSKYIGYEKSENGYNPGKVTTILITSLLFEVSFLKFGTSVVLLKAVSLSSILIVAAFIDIKYQLIPDKIVIIALTVGAFALLSGDITVRNALIGMFAGGALLFLLALVPGAIGGGDIKFMFSLGLFLGLRKIIIALILSFIFAGIVSGILILFKLKEKKDYMPLGPFIALASFIAFHFFT